MTENGIEHAPDMAFPCSTYICTERELGHGEASVRFLSFPGFESIVMMWVSRFQWDIDIIWGRNTSWTTSRSRQCSYSIWDIRGRNMKSNMAAAYDFVANCSLVKCLRTIGILNRAWSNPASLHEKAPFYRNHFKVQSSNAIPQQLLVRALPLKTIRISPIGTYLTRIKAPQVCKGQKYDEMGIFMNDPLRPNLLIYTLPLF
jgi:hypothetical protein